MRAPLSFAAERTALIAACRASVREGLIRGTSGNLSVRAGEGFLITPTGYGADRVEAEDLVWMPLATEGEGEGRLKPSSEWRFHRDLYRTRPDCAAVVHAHSPYATTLACLRREIPPFHYMIAVAGGTTIRCARYATFGTQALSDAVLEAMVDRRACLMANHGLVAIGPTPEKTLAIALEVEELCGQYWRACQLGEPVLLSEAEMAEVLVKFKTYGQQPQR
ncbi:MAG: class II aldolase/adducin family protein [Casimicrobiaceae bacterium]|nr:class II aldolase/adducin family protein [Casimicrobiaceae bacterium]